MPHEIMLILTPVGKERFIVVHTTFSVYVWRLLKSAHRLTAASPPFAIITQRMVQSWLVCCSSQLCITCYQIPLCLVCDLHWAVCKADCNILF